MVEAGTKYLAMSMVSVLPDISFLVCDIFRLIMPNRHLRLASNTPDPEFPVRATSAITVLNLRTPGGNFSGGKIRDRAVPSGTTVITASPGQGSSAHKGLRRSLKRSGNRPSSTASSV